MNLYVLFVLSVLLFPPLTSAAEIQNLTFTAADGVEIAADWRLKQEAPGPRLLVVAPGFAQDTSTRSMQALAQGLTQVADVLCLDFRGTGKSRGRFWFGSKEYLDLMPVLAWARGRYRDVSLLGLSLGAYHSFRAVAEGASAPDRLLLVSCPTKMEWILLNGGAFWHSINYPFKRIRYKIPPQNAPFFRWGPVFASKPNAVELGAKVKVPVFFLVGGEDDLIHESLSREVFESVAGPRQWKRMEHGAHAEVMYLQDPTAFLDWVREALESRTALTNNP